MMSTSFSLQIQTIRPGNLQVKSIFKKLLKTCRAKDILVVLDERFIEFCRNEFSMLDETEEYDNLLLVRAFTKIFAIPGVRLGYLVCSNRSLIENIRKHLPEWNISVFAEEAGIACASQSAFAARTVEYVREERKFLSDGLKQLGLKTFPVRQILCFVYSERPLYEELLKRGILIRDCGNFRGLSKGYYRIAVKSRKEKRDSVGNR